MEAIEGKEKGLADLQRAVRVSEGRPEPPRLRLTHWVLLKRIEKVNCGSLDFVVRVKEAEAKRRQAAAVLRCVCEDLRKRREQVSFAQKQT